MIVTSQEAQNPGYRMIKLYSLKFFVYIIYNIQLLRTFMKSIVLDCDGVILDYNETWGRILSQFLQKEIKAKKLAYHHTMFLIINFLQKKQKSFIVFFIIMVGLVCKLLKEQ